MPVPSYLVPAIRKAVIGSLLFLTATLPSCAQTSQEISSLLRKSKLVDTGRDVNTRVGDNEMTISTYAHPKASDQDVKITALFMMKEIRQHYKNILNIDVLFYDPGNTSRYREVEIREGDIALVDAKKPIKEVLAQISVRDHKAQPASAAATATATAVSSEMAGGRSFGRGGFHHGGFMHGGGGGPPAPLVNALATTVGKLIPGALSTSDELAYFQSPSGEIQLKAPKTWAQDASGMTGDLMLFGIYRTGSMIHLHVARPIQASGTLESLASQRLSQAQQEFGAIKVLTRRNQTCAGVPAIYVMGTAAFHPNETYIERDLMFRKNDRVYCVYMQSSTLNDQGLETLFQSVADSIIIR